MNIEKITYPKTTFVAIRQEARMDQLKDLIPGLFGALFGFCTQNNIEMVGQPASLYYTWDMENKITDFAAAIPVTNDLASVDANKEGIQLVVIEESEAMMGEHWGDYEKLGDSHMELWKYTDDNKLELNMPVVEQYITDPGEEPDTSKWLTKIHYLIK